MTSPARIWGGLAQKARETRRMGPADWWFTLATAVVLATIEVLMRVLPTPAVARILGVPLDLSSGRSAPTEHFDMDLTVAEQRRVRSVGRVLRRHPSRAGLCIQESLLLGHHLRAHRPVLRLGVRLMDGAPLFHAWVELAGTNTGGAGFTLMVSHHSQAPPCPHLIDRGGERGAPPS